MSFVVNTLQLNALVSASSIPLLCHVCMVWWYQFLPFNEGFAVILWAAS